MPQGITDYQAFLQEARQAVINLQQDKDAYEQLRKEEKRLERALESERKAVEDSVRLTVKKRQDEINGSYDKQLSKAQEQIRKTRAKRERAKNQGIRERIAEETEAFRDHNRELKIRLYTLFQQSGAPGFCKSSLYYALYMPRTVREYLCLMGALLLCFLVIPCVVYFLIPGHKWWMLVLIYFLDILLFGGSYMSIHNRTKSCYLETFREGRQIRDLIADNKKKIRVITNSIRKDSSEVHYNLQKYDDAIAKQEHEMAQLANAKAEALNTFEKVTKNIITDEIVASSRDRIDQLTREYQQSSAGRKEKEKFIKARSLDITDRYEGFLGKEFLNARKIDELLDLLERGTAANLAEAIEFCNRKNQGQN